MTRLPGLMLGLLLAGAAPAEAPEAPKPVTLDAATIHRLGIATAPAHQTTSAHVVTGFARVLDPGPLAQLDSDIAAAAPAASASTAEATRSQALFAADATVSRKVAETAASQARADSAKLALLRRRLNLEWGPTIAALSDARRGALVTALASGRAALVRIDSAGGTGQAGLRSVTLDLGELGSATGTILGPARMADPRLQSPGLIARVSGSQAQLLSAGLTVPVRMAGSARASVFVPASAALRVGGATWVYVQATGGRFDRRRLGGTSAAPGGLNALQGLRDGERIVVSGASALYAAEQGGGHEED